MRRRFAGLGVLLGAAAITFPFLFDIAGDAQIHLVVAENFASGLPFRFNPSGPIVAASTSPFWTLLLASFYWIAGRFSPLILKIACLLVWGLVSFWLFQNAQKTFHLKKQTTWLLMAVWLTSSPIVANALGGMENILSAWQLLLVLQVCVQYLRQPSVGKSAVLGLLLGWAILTRLDGGLFAGLLIGYLFIIRLVGFKKESTTPGIGGIVRHLLIALGACLLVVLPWYLYQVSLTGKIVTDSSIARLYTGRRTSLEIIPNLLYFQPKPLLTLATYFLPLLVGLVFSIQSLIQLRSAGKTFSGTLKDNYPQVASLILIFAGFFFYSFVLGADHFGRYFLPIFPFLFLNGFAGLQNLIDKISSRQYKLQILAFVFLLLFFLLGSGADYYRRIVLGQLYENNLSRLLVAPLNRKAYTDEYLHNFGFEQDARIKIAMTEVQLRYLVDERITVLSLDGRTSPELLRLVDRRNGIPDFERYFEIEKPDLVALGQWCTDLGWSALIFPTTFKDNLVCQWEKQVATLGSGDTFAWQGHQATFFPPNKVRIDWK